MPDQISEHYTTEFTSNWVARIAQTRARLEPWVDIISFDGERKRWDRIGPATSRKRVERIEPTPITSSVMDSRWAYRESYNLARIMDADDAMNLGQLVLPTSEYVQSFGAEYNRNFDDLAAAIALRPVKTGELGTTDFALPTAQRIAEAGTAGLTKNKFIAAQGILIGNEIDPNESRVLVITSRQLTDLFGISEFVNADFNSSKPLAGGATGQMQWMGFNIVINNRLPKIGNMRQCVAWTKGSVKMMKGSMATKISERDDLSRSIQIYGAWHLGGTRVQDEGVVVIECYEAP